MKPCNPTIIKVASEELLSDLIDFIRDSETAPDELRHQAAQWENEYFGKEADDPDALSTNHTDESFVPLESVETI